MQKIMKSKVFLAIALMLLLVISIIVASPSSDTSSSSNLTTASGKKPKQYSCGRSGDIVVLVDDPSYCTGNLSVKEGVKVTMKYEPRKGKSGR